MRVSAKLVDDPSMVDEHVNPIVDALSAYRRICKLDCAYGALATSTVELDDDVNHGSRIFHSFLTP